jgi:thiol-disulfide isomerase/thioredoxin
VLVTWFAEWCANCGYEAPILGDLHRRWRDRGLAVVARSEYSHPDEVQGFLGRHALHVPVVPGSPNPDPEEEDAVRTSTAHYELRRALGDERKWGTPLTLVFAHGGDSAWAVLGELVPEEMEAFVARRLTGPEP